MTPPWFRVSIDLDHDGNWRGASWEARQDDRIIGITVMPEPGPFESAPDLIEQIVEDITERYGVQLRLL